MSDANSNVLITEGWLEALERRSRSRVQLSCAEALNLIEHLKNLLHERDALARRTKVIEKSLLADHPTMSDADRKRAWAEAGWIV